MYKGVEVKLDTFSAI